LDYYQNLGWIDEYISNVSSFVHVRKEDSILIKIPNEAYKLNEQGIKILQFLFEGNSIYEIADSYKDTESVSKDLYFFFCDLKALLKGCYNEKTSRIAVEKIPFELPYNSLPVLSEIAITYRCNLSCKFCYSSCGCSKSEDSTEMDTASIKSVLDIIRNEAQVPSVSFTGGEPTLRKDLPEIIRHAKSLKMWTNLITNGSLLTKDLACSLKHAGLDSAQVSLEASNETLHDDLVGHKGAFEKTIQGLQNLMDEGIRVHTNTTINRLNMNHLGEILSLVKRLKLDKFSMNMITPQGTALNSPDKINVHYSEIGQTVLETSDRAREMGLEFMWYSPTPICIFNPVVHGLGNKGCAACDGLLSVSPNGDILPCSSYFKPLANILKHKGDFKGIWQSKDFSYFQKKLFAHDLCQDCEHLAICNGACPIYWDQFGYKELLNTQAGVSK